MLGKEKRHEKIILFVHRGMLPGLRQLAKADIPARDKNIEYAKDCIQHFQIEKQLDDGISRAVLPGCFGVWKEVFGVSKA